MGLLRKYRFALTGLGLGLLLWTVSLGSDFCLAEYLTTAMLWVSAHGYLLRLDELLVMALLVCLGLGVDIFLRHRALQAEIKEMGMKASTVRSTALSVRDSVLNTYNGFQLVIMKAREGSVSEDLLGSMEKRIEVSSAELNSLTGMQEIIEREISGGGRYVDPNTSR